MRSVFLSFVKDRSVVRLVIAVGTLRGRHGLAFAHIDGVDHVALGIHNIVGARLGKVSPQFSLIIHLRYYYFAEMKKNYAATGKIPRAFSQKQVRERQTR